MACEKDFLATAKRNFKSMIQHPKYTLLRNTIEAWPQQIHEYQNIF